MKKKKNIIITAVMIVLIAIIAIILVKVNSSNVKNKEVKGIKPGTEAVKTKADTQTEDDSTTDKSGIEEFALFGVDSRSDQLDKGTRSDSIMVVRVDHDAKKIRMVSIFRDCMMNIDGHGYQKVTHAHAFGGPELAVDTLNKNLDLDIKNYVTVNFNTVGEIVDEVGGIVQDIDASEAKVINGYIDEVNKVRGTSSSHIDSAGTHNSNFKIDHMKLLPCQLLTICVYYTKITVVCHFLFTKMKEQVFTEWITKYIYNWRK